MLTDPVDTYKAKPPDRFYQPWRCLCLPSLQMTRTTPLRRTILQFLQIFLTDARTFIAMTPTFLLNKPD